MKPTYITARDRQYSYEFAPYGWMNWVRSLTKGDITKITAVLSESYYTTLTWRRMNLHESEFMMRDSN